LGRQHFCYVMDGQKSDYLSRALQRVRGATKNATQNESRHRRVCQHPVSHLWICLLTYSPAMSSTAISLLPSVAHK